MKRLPIIVICALGFWSCGAFSPRPAAEETRWKQVFEREHLTDSSALILYVAQGMCAECINKELINLKEHPEIARNTVIIGSFANKRHFLASVASAKVKRRIFVPANEMSNIDFAVYMQPHYMLYVASSRTFEQPYYPADCSTEKTIEYYRDIRSRFLVGD